MPKMGGNNSWDAWQTNNLINKLQADKHCEQMPNFVEDGFIFKYGGGYNHHIGPGIAYLSGFRVEAALMNLTLIDGINFVYLVLNKVPDGISGYTSASSLSLEIKTQVPPGANPAPPTKPYILIYWITVIGGVITALKDMQRHNSIPRFKDENGIADKYINRVEGEWDTSLNTVMRGDKVEGWNFDIIDSATKNVVSLRRTPANTLQPLFVGGNPGELYPCRGLRGRGYYLQGIVGVAARILRAVPTPDVLLQMNNTGILICTRFFLGPFVGLIPGTTWTIFEKGAIGTGSASYSLKYNAITQQFIFKVGNGGAWSNTVSFAYAGDVQRWFHVVCGHDILSNNIFLSVNGAPFNVAAPGIPLGLIVGGPIYFGSDLAGADITPGLLLDEFIMRNDAAISELDSNIPFEYYNHGLGLRFNNPSDIGTPEQFNNEVGDTTYPNDANVNLIKTLISRNITISRRTFINVSSVISIDNQVAAARDYQIRVGINGVYSQWMLGTAYANDYLSLFNHFLLDRTPASIPETITIDTQVQKPVGTGIFVVRGNQRILTTRGE